LAEVTPPQRLTLLLDDSRLKAIQRWLWVLSTGGTLLDGFRRRRTDALIASLLICVLSIFTVYLLVGRHKRYRELNGEKVPNWWVALWRAVNEMSGTLYCVGVVTSSAVGFVLIILMRTPGKI
jgi:ABC-type uncharacterized transport system YnjBCD permease subunit